MGTAKLYSQKPKGIDINGLIKDYYVYAGENVNAGDFVEFVNGIASTISTGYSGGYSDLSNAGEYSAYVNMYSAIPLGTDKIFIGYRINENSALYGKILTISGMRITQGSNYTLYSGTHSDNNVSFTKIDDTTVLVGSEDSEDDGICAICTISGSTISRGSWFEYSDASDAAYNSFSALTSTSILCAYSSGNSTYGKCKILTRDGTTLTDNTSYYVVGSATNQYGKYIFCGALSSTVAAICYYYGRRIVKATISGTTITWGSYTALNSINSNFQLFPISSTRYMLVCKNDSSEIDVYIINNSVELISTILAISTTYQAFEAITFSKQLNKLVILEKNGTIHQNAVFTYANNTLTTTATNNLNLNNSITKYQSTIIFHDSTTIPLLFIGGVNSTDKKIGGQIVALKNNELVSSYTETETTYETQVRPVTTSKISGVAKTRGTGGTSLTHNEQVSIITPPPQY